MSDAVITNLHIYGLENAVRGSKFPMCVDVNNPTPEWELGNLNYWLQFGNFLYDFVHYQEKYGKNKGLNNKDSCMFCGSNIGVNKIVRYDNNFYCAKCAHQIDRYGHPFETTPQYILNDNYVEMTVYGHKKNSKTVKISYESLPSVFYQKWVTCGDKYIKNGDNEFLHSFLFKDVLQENEVVDHINRDIYDNRLCNLRVCTRQENSMNCGVSKNNKTGITGVSWDKEKSKWRSSINIDRKQKFLGYYSDFDSAVKARLLAEHIYFGEFAPQQHLYNKYDIGIEATQFKSDRKIYDLNDAIKGLKRAIKLGKTGIGQAHDQYLTAIIAQFDLTFTVKAWTEAERYHFFDFISSQSTMHRISKFDLANQYSEYVDRRMIDIMNELKDRYNETQDKEDYLKLLYSNPCGFKLTAAMTTNFRQLKTIYYQRKNHRLPEWVAFCKQLEAIPEFRNLVLGLDGE